MIQFTRCSVSMVATATLLSVGFAGCSGSSDVAPASTVTVTAPAPSQPQPTPTRSTPSPTPPPEEEQFEGEGRHPPFGIMLENAKKLCLPPVSGLPDLVKQGDSPEFTTVLQTVAYTLGYEIQVAGVYDAPTIRAVKQMQTDLGVVPDGQVGPKTWTAIRERHCPEYEQYFSDDYYAADCRGYDLVELQDGAVSGRLGSYGIWTNDPSTGRFVGMGGVIDQMWSRWLGSPTEELSNERLELDLQGGFIGADMRKLFGDFPYIYERMVEGLRIKASKGSARCS